MAAGMAAGMAEWPKRRATRPKLRLGHHRDDQPARAPPQRGGPVVGTEIPEVALRLAMVPPCLAAGLIHALPETSYGGILRSVPSFPPRQPRCQVRHNALRRQGRR
jgi:hypothetical protein